LPNRQSDDKFLTLKHVGVAQGAPTSPLLSMLILNTAFARFKNKLSMYADDGYIYFDDDGYLDNEDFSVFKDFGIEFNMEKSGYVKRQGK
jgi:CMP-N-acetylneuraminic acid synthetase